MSIDELTAKLDASDAKIAELTALNSEFEKENISLTAKITELTEANCDLSATIALLKNHNAEAGEAHSAELAKLNTELAESKKETATLREQSARFGAPAPKAPAQEQEKKSTTAGLTGLAKAIAAHKAENAA